MLPQLKNILLLAVVAILFTSCSDGEYLPKAKAFLRLDYPNANYKAISTNCPYNFEIPDNTQADFNEKCWVNLKYPRLNAAIDITYRPVENNLSELLREAEKLTYKHAIKADNISGIPFENTKKKKYGALIEVTGNAASPIQFHLTDSTKHFITGALYFDVRPNYDSILPTVKYIEKDIQHLMETLNWK